MSNKINKQVFLNRVSKRTGLSMRVVRNVYDGIVDELLDSAIADDRVSLSGFGCFSKHSHKGHPVQFGGAGSVIADYDVYKFSPSSSFMRRLRN